VIPKEHAVCLGALSEKMLDEFSDISEYVKSAIRSEYNLPTVAFEHGILGQSVPHAHLQVMPSATDLFPFIIADFKVYKELSSVKELRELHCTKGVYLYYQDPQDKQYGFVLDSYPQYLRFVAAKAIGKPMRGDWRAWRADPEAAKLDDFLVEDTVERLRRHLPR
jgi:hypothetical protein